MNVVFGNHKINHIKLKHLKNQFSRNLQLDINLKKNSKK